MSAQLVGQQQRQQERLHTDCRGPLPAPARPARGAARLRQPKADQRHTAWALPEKRREANAKCLEPGCSLAAKGPQAP